MDVNDATEKVTGIDRDNLIGSDFSNYFTEPEKARAGYLKVFTEGYVTDYPLSIRRRDGRITHVLYNASVYRDSSGVVQGVFAAARDITAQKEAEKRISEIARYESAHSQILTEFNSSQNRVSVLTHLLDILAENNSYLMSAFYGFDEWTGILSCEASHGLNAGSQKQYHLGDGLIGEAAKNNKKRVLRDVDSDEFTIDVGFAKIKPKTVIITPVSYQEKRLGVFLMVSRENSSDDELAFIERLCVQTGVALHNIKQYEDMKVMTEKLRERNEEIELKNAQLDEASKMKSEFLANMSHELRTPLNAILGFSEAMRDSLFGDVNPKQEEGLSVVYESGQHLLSLINDILDLSKIEAGKMELDCTNFNINEVVNRSISIIKEKANKHNIHISLDVDSQIGEISADERKVKQVLFNLLSNASKFTPDNGSITITTKLHENTQPICHVDEKRRTDYVSIAIRDTGIGIAASDLERLFTPFEQLDGSFSKKYQGTGLGLAMVKRLAELHNGCVEVESELEKGSCFTVWLPVVNREELFVEDKNERLSNLLETKKHVLLVNNNDQDAAVVRTILEGAGIEVYRCNNTSDIDEKLERYNIDAILAEVAQGELEEIQNCKQVMDSDVKIPIILLKMDHVDYAGVAIKPSSIVNKPIDKNSLLRAVVSAGINVNAKLMRDYSIMVVDDDPNSINLISTYLEHDNIRVTKAYSGEQAIAEIEHAVPDLIILDLMMPGVTGFDVVAYLQAKSLSDIPVVIVTAKIITETDIHQLSGKVSNIIEKFDIDQQGFVSYIEHLLGNDSDR